MIVSMAIVSTSIRSTVVELTIVPTIIIPTTIVPTIDGSAGVASLAREAFVERSRRLCWHRFSVSERPFDPLEKALSEFDLVTAGLGERFECLDLLVVQ